jgi:hypothetical protein
MTAKIWTAPSSNAFQTTLDGTLSSGETTIRLSSVLGLQAPGILVIDRQDGSGNDTPTTREYISYESISGYELIGVTRGLGGSVDKTHTSGALVESVMDVTYWNDMREFMLVEHNTDGTHDNVSLDSSADFITEHKADGTHDNVSLDSSADFITEHDTDGTHKDVTADSLIVDGDVGIGTTVPKENLDVKGNIIAGTDINRRYVSKALGVKTGSDANQVWILTKADHGSAEAIGTLIGQRSSGHRQARRVDFIYSTDSNGNNYTTYLEYSGGDQAGADEHWDLVKFTYDSKTWIGLRFTGAGHSHSNAFFSGYIKSSDHSRVLQNLNTSEVSSLSVLSYATSQKYMHGGLQNIGGGYAIGSKNSSNETDLDRNSIQIASDTSYGGTHNNHSAYRIHAEMPGGWGSGELHFSCATNWRTYDSTPTMVLSGQDVGIGCASPDYRLEVRSSTQNDIVSRVASSSSWARFGMITDQGMIGYLIAYGSTHAEKNNVALKSTKGDLDFFAGGGGTSNKHVSIKTDGKFYAPNLGGSSSANSDLRYSTSTKRIYYQTSSKRYKTNIRELEIDTKLIYKLKPKSFKDKKTKQDDFGLIAEEVFEHIPEIVPLDKEGKPVGVNYKMLSVLLLGEIKKLRKEVKQLKIKHG